MINANKGASINFNNGLDKDSLSRLSGQNTVSKILDAYAARTVLRALSACAVLCLMLAWSAATMAAPVQYVKICDLFGAGYFYIPGTDKCGDANIVPYKVQTAYGPVTNTPGTNATAYGEGSFAYGDQSLTIGSEAWAGGDPTTASPGPANVYKGIAPGSAFSNAGTTAIGANARAGAGGSGQINATAVGESATANAIGATAVGQASNASGDNSTAFGISSTASGANAVAVGSNSNASYAGAVAVGAGAQATADPATAVGNNAMATGNNSTALGANAAASGSNSVALGAGSIASEANTFSIGSPGNERRITNIAAGVNPGDAVNVTQFSDGLATTLDQANAYTDSRLDGFQSNLGRLGIRLDHVGAMNMAMAQMTASAASIRQDNRIAIGLGVYGGSTGVAMGYQRAIGNKGSLTLGGAFSGNEVAGGAGVGFGW